MSTNPFIDPYRLTPDEEAKLLDCFKGDGIRLLDKLFLYKTAMLRDRAMATESDEEMKQFKWGAAAVAALIVDIRTFKAKKKLREEDEMEKKIAVEKKKKDTGPKRAFGPESIQVS